jgi:hypothetical protein
MRLFWESGRIKGMSTKLHIAFKNIKQERPIGDLAGLVMKRIDAEIAKKAKRNMMLARFGMGASMAVLAYVSFTAGSAIIGSEFFDLAKLAFSDAAIVLQNWREFTYSLLETLPVMNITMLLSPIFTLLLSYAAVISLQGKAQHKFPIHCS